MAAMYQRERQTADAAGRQAWQARRFDAMVQAMLHGNAFYRTKWRGLESSALNFAHLAEFPLTAKAELQADQAAHPPFGTNLGAAPADYTRVHQTSGTTGRPLRVLDTAQSWGWWAECWRYVLDAAGVGPDDVVMLAFSFGPFIGFWAAQEALGQMGALCVPGGGMSSAQRLELMRELGATVLICTPSYALHLAEVAAQQGLDPARDLQVRVTLHAGEPGASVPATRQRIETLWGAVCFDHPGASEVGAFGFSCSGRGGVHVNEAEFIAEILNPETGEPVQPGAPGELVLTNLGRLGFPVVRYRTGDWVRAAEAPCPCGRTGLLLEQGILGRIDDMVTVRGINVFPAAFLAIFSDCPWVAEHRITAYRRAELDQLHVEFEAAGAGREAEVQELIRNRLGLRASVAQVGPGALPRYELKAGRFIDRRGEDWMPPPALGS